MKYEEVRRGKYYEVWGSKTRKVFYISNKQVNYYHIKYWQHFSSNKISETWDKTDLYFYLVSD